MAYYSNKSRSYYKSPVQTFNDGIVNIYSVGNIAEPGNKPKDGLTIKVSALRYDERIVGMSRFWAAKQENTKIERLIRAPKIKSVEQHDVVVLEGSQYDIVQIQYPQDVDPPSMDLSLERLEVAYEVN